MRKSLRVKVYTVLLGGLLLIPVSAWPDACSDAVDRFSLSVRQIDWPIRQFASCVSYSKGRDDCSSEFRRVRSAYDDFDAAVGRYRRECH
jgi:hypothetical protein